MNAFLIVRLFWRTRIVSVIAARLFIFWITAAMVSAGTHEAPAVKESSGGVAAKGPLADKDAEGEPGLRGFVCGPEGKAIPKATVLVNLRPISMSEEGTFFVPHAQLERQGPTLLIMVQAEHEGKKLCRAQFIDYATGKENVTSHLWQSKSIQGRVLSPEGDPIQGAKVVTFMNVGNLTCHGTCPVGDPAVTDTAGKFRVNDLYPDMNYKLWVTCTRRERKWSDWIPMAGWMGVGRANEDVKVVLREAPGFITGRVMDNKGAPVAKEKVVLGHPCIPDAVSITDVKGNFRIEDLIPGGEVTLSVRWKFQKVKVGSENIVFVIQNRKP
jgi:hypothetical protein